MATITIYVPNDLKDRMNTLTNTHQKGKAAQVNWSDVAQKAFIAELEKHKQLAH